jgi:ABC-type lipoprotein export system ATPase subunit
VLSVLRLKLWRMLVLDEALGAVSDEYVDQTGQFLRSLCEKLNLDLLLVTHKPPFLDHANRSYRCTEEVGDDGVTRWLSLRSNHK